MERRSCPRIAVSFPVEYGLLPWFRRRDLQAMYRRVCSADRNPTGSLALPEPEPWAVFYITLARSLGRFLPKAGRRNREVEDKIESAACLDLSENGLRMATSYPLWAEAFLHLRIPSRSLASFGYTVLGRVVRVAPIDQGDAEVGVCFAAIHPLDRQGLARFLAIPQPKLAAMRRRSDRPASNHEV